MTPSFVTQSRLGSWFGISSIKVGKILTSNGLKDRHGATQMAIAGKAERAARTSFNTLEEFAHFTLLEAHPITGRTHQIRLHFAALGHPVAGDRTYGVAGELWLERQFLHAARLAFEHPVTGAAVDVSSPLPPDLAAALAAARS